MDEKGYSFKIGDMVEIINSGEKGCVTEIGRIIGKDTYIVVKIESGKERVFQKDTAHKYIRPVGMDIDKWRDDYIDSDKRFDDDRKKYTNEEWVRNTVYIRQDATGNRQCIPCPLMEEKNGSLRVIIFVPIIYQALMNDSGRHGYRYLGGYIRHPKFDRYDLEWKKNYIRDCLQRNYIDGEIFLDFFKNFIQGNGYEEEHDVVRPDLDSVAIQTNMKATYLQITKVVSLRGERNRRVVFSDDHEGIIPASMAQEGVVIKREYLKETKREGSKETEYIYTGP